MSDDQKQNNQANYENHIHERELDPKELAEMLRIRKFNEGDEYQNRTVNHISERPFYFGYNNIGSNIHSF